MKKNVLVIYFSQSGQMRQILDQITIPLNEIAKIDFVEIKPEFPFPFPWTTTTFFDAMPESVLLIPPQIKAIPEIENKTYDLIILGYQPWFLSPSQPTTGFLTSEWAQVLKNTPVVTVIGCRNMWLNAQEKVKSFLYDLEANHCGHVVLEDKHSNLTALKSITRWMFTGQKVAEGKPEAGVCSEDIKSSKRFGNPILKSLKENNFNHLQEELLRLNSIELRPNLIVMEKRGISQFPKWAKRAVRKGKPGSEARKPVIKRFQRLLIVAIFVLSPITTLIATIQTALNKKKLLSEVSYFKSVHFKPNKL